MHRRIIAGVSALLFVLMALLASIVTDLHDRSLPQQLGATAAVGLDFSESGMSAQQAFDHLARVSEKFELGLVKVVPDLSGDQSGKIIVSLGREDDFPEEIGWFGSQPIAPVVDSEYLANSHANGQYLLTGDTAQVEEFSTWLVTQQVGTEWNFDTAGASLRAVFSQASFAVSVLAAAVLMTVLVLYWFSIKAKGRALRVLAGTPTWRIQYEDLAGFLAPILLAAVVCDVATAVYIGAVNGWVYVPYFTKVILMLEGILLLATMACAVIVSVASWPSAAMLAARQPAIKSLRKSSTVLRAGTLVLVIATVGPAVAALNASQEVSAQQAKWKSLADQVSIGFRPTGGPGGLEAGFQRLMNPVGDLTMEAQRQGIATFSYVWEPDQMEMNEIDAGPYQSLALTNHQWLDLMGVKLETGASESSTAPQLKRLPRQQIPGDIKQFLAGSMKLWVREDTNPDDALNSLSFYEYSGSSTIPMARGGSGDLVFLDNVIVVLVEDLRVFSDDFLLSVTSSSNLSYTGLAATQELITRHGLQREAHAQYIAEEGVLRAQFTAYFAWLQGIALTALSVALVVSSVIGAFITAVIKSRRDFPLRLAGLPWWQILAGRVGSEWLVGGSLAAGVVIIMAVQGSQYLALMGAAAVGGLLLSPLAHFLATRWSFKTISLRKL